MLNYRNINLNVLIAAARTLKMRTSLARAVYVKYTFGVEGVFIFLCLSLSFFEGGATGISLGIDPHMRYLKKKKKIRETAKLLKMSCPSIHY